MNAIKLIGLNKDTKKDASPGSPSSPTRTLNMKYKFTAEEFEDIINGYKNRKPNKYPDLELLNGDMGGNA